MLSRVVDGREPWGCLALNALVAGRRRRRALLTSGMHERMIGLRSAAARLAGGQPLTLPATALTESVTDPHQRLFDATRWKRSGHGYGR